MTAHGTEWRRLWLAGAAFAVGTAVHTFDHVRRGQGSVSDELFAAGNVALALQIVVITLILTRHPQAPVLALTGLPLASAFIASHWLPHWSALSDSFVDDGAAAFSWFASAAEISGAIAIAVAGLAVLRTSRAPSAAP